MNVLPEAGPEARAPRLSQVPQHTCAQKEQGPMIRVARLWTSMEGESRKTGCSSKGDGEVSGPEHVGGPVRGGLS